MNGNFRAVGAYRTLRPNEEVLIEGSEPVKIMNSKGITAFLALDEEKDKKEGFFSRLTVKYRKDDELFGIPYLTNQRILIWIVHYSKEDGLYAKWTELPLEFISEVKTDTVGGMFFNKSTVLRIGYRIPQMQRGFFRKLIGLGAAEEKIDILIDVTNKTLWQAHLTKLRLGERPQKESVLVSIRGKLECPKCKIEVSKETIFCPNCGTRLGGFCVCGAPLQSGNKFCSSCGKPLP